MPLAASRALRRRAHSPLASHTHSQELFTPNAPNIAFSLDGVYQRDMHRRGQYYANAMFLEQLHARQDSVVADPEQVRARR